MSVFWSEASRPEIQSGPLHEQATAANLRQWEAVAYHEPFGPAPTAEEEAAEARYVAAMQTADDYGAYLALRVEEEPKWTRCDGCGKDTDLNDDGTVVTADDEVICGKCCEVRVEE
jgi:hypothetical protein